MMEAITALPKDVQELIEYTEWSTKSKEGMRKFLDLKGRVLPTVFIQGDLVFQCKIPLYEELIDAMVARAPQPEMTKRIKSLRDEGFDFAKVQENLTKAGSGLKTKVV
jgi:hypothetical protein